MRGHAHLLGRAQLALEVIVQRFFGWMGHHFYFSMARSLVRTLNTWLFEVPSLTPSISLICRCSSPSMSCSTNATRHPSGSRATARSMSMRCAGCLACGRHVMSVFVELAGGRAHTALAAPEKIEALPNGKPIQPRAQRRVAAIAVELAMDLQKNLLEQVFTLMRRSRHSAGEGKEARRMLTVERFEGIAIPLPAARDQFGIRPAQAWGLRRALSRWSCRGVGRPG